MPRQLRLEYAGAIYHVMRVLRVLRESFRSFGAWRFEIASEPLSFRGLLSGDYGQKTTAEQNGCTEPGDSASVPGRTPETPGR